MLCRWKRATHSAQTPIRPATGPKKAKLADAEEKLRVATEKLNGKREELAAVVPKPPWPRCWLTVALWWGKGLTPTSDGCQLLGGRSR